MGAEALFIGLAVLSVGAFLGVVLSAVVRRLKGDRIAFQSRLQSEQLQKQAREMRDKSARLEELEAERLRLEAASEAQARNHQEQLDQLTQIRNQIGEQLEVMSKQAATEGQALLAQATEQLLKERERTGATDHARSDAAIGTVVEQLTQIRSQIGEKFELLSKQATSEGQALLAQAAEQFARERERLVGETEHSRSDAAIGTMVEQLTQMRSQIGEKLELLLKQATSDGQALLAQAAEQFARERERLVGETDHSRSDAAIGTIVEQLTQMRSQIGEKIELLSKQATSDGRALLAQAAEQFARERERLVGETDHSRSESALRTLIQPINDTLARFDQKLAAIEDNRRQSLGAIVGHLEQVARVHADVRNETRRLADALESSPRATRHWRGQQLKNVLELAGMAPYVDLVPPDPARKADGLQPAAVLRLPGNRRLAIDANAPTGAYMEAVAAKDAADEERALDRHASQIRAHLEKLAAEEYRQGFDIRPELAVMFLPGENMLASALAKDPALFEDGIKRHVLMATPTTLVALARSVAHGWEQEQSLENVRELASIGAELFDRMAQVGDQVDELGRGLETSVRSYNNFVGELQGSVMAQLRRLRDFKPVGEKRELREPQPVDVSVRVPRRRRNFVITQAGQEAAAAITFGPEGPPIPAPARAMTPSAAPVATPAPEPPRPTAAPVEPF